MMYKDEELTYEILTLDDFPECEYRQIRSNEPKCIAERQDIHICVGNIPKYKCPMYRLKQEAISKERECENLKIANQSLSSSWVNVMSEKLDIIQENKKIKQALEKIEKLCVNECDVLNDNWNKEKENFTKPILDIINEAKNER